MTTRVFRSGNSQAVRLPREFQLDCDTVEIERRGDEIVLRKSAATLGQAIRALPVVSSDFFAKGRKQPKTERRQSL